MLGYCESMVPTSLPIKENNGTHFPVPPRQINYSTRLSTVMGLRCSKRGHDAVQRNCSENVNTNVCAFERPRLFRSHTWKGASGRHGLSRQWDIKLAWCVLLFNWPWNINRFGIHWLTFDWGETEQPASDVCNWIVAVSADIMSKHRVAYFYLFAPFFLYLFRL